MASPDSIEKVWAREVLNFLGNPTVEAEVFLADGTRGRAAVPAGSAPGAPRRPNCLTGTRDASGAKASSRRLKTSGE